MKMFNSNSKFIKILSYFLLSRSITFDFEKEWNENPNREEILISGSDYDKIDGSLLPQFKKLKNLTISRTSIVELPDSLCECESLEKLNCFNTKIQKLPNAIGNLKNLKVIDAKGVLESKSILTN